MILRSWGRTRVTTGLQRRKLRPWKVSNRARAPEPVGGSTGVGAGGWPWGRQEEGHQGRPHLIKQGDVEGEPEAVMERGLVG